jgi:hypothetical protein
MSELTWRPDMWDPVPHQQKTVQNSSRIRGGGGGLHVRSGKFVGIQHLVCGWRLKLKQHL